MSNIDHIKKPISAELNLFEDKFRAAMRSKAPLLDRITHYIVKRKGKQVRPMFVFLSAKIFGDIAESTYRAASLIELLHTATLVHDDVVDNANERRGFFSINALWKNKIAVLVGDYLLSRGLLLSVEHKEYELLSIVSEAVKQMSEGELLQIEKVRRFDISEQLYYDVIRQKTASLIAACCAAGASSAGQSPEMVERLRLFGENVGMAFQIKDDLLDFSEADTGKAKGIDLKEKKITLPLIMAIQNCTSTTERRRIVLCIKNEQDEKVKFDTVWAFIKNNNGIQASEKIMDKYCNEAMALIHDISDSPSKEALKNLVDFTVYRQK